MGKLVFHLITSALLLSVTISAAELTPDYSPQAEPQFITLEFEAVDIGVVAKFFDDLTGKHHVVEGGNQKIDLVQSQRLSVDDAEKLFISVVQKLGYQVSVEGDTIRMTSPTFRAQSTIRSLRATPAQ